MTLRIGWFSTGAGEGSQRWRIFRAAAEQARLGEFGAEVVFVFCNRERGEDAGTDSFLDLAESFGIRTLTLSSRRFRKERGGALSTKDGPLPAWRMEYDRAVADIVSQHPFDVGILTGYMLIFTPEMAGRFPFLNLHPAAPGGPAGTWQDVIWQLIDARASQSGVMIHLATADLDQGPVVAYCTFELRGPEFDALWAAIRSRTAAELQTSQGEQQPLFAAVRRQGAARELPLVIATLRAFAEGRVRIDRGRVVDAEGNALKGGLDLTREIDAVVAVSR